MTIVSWGDRTTHEGSERCNIVGFEDGGRGARTKKHRKSPGARKTKGPDLLLDLPEKQKQTKKPHGPLDTLILRLYQTSNLTNSKIVNSCSLKPLFVVICYKATENEYALCQEFSATH